MNPTQNPNNTGHEPGPVAPTTRILDLADLLSDGGRFRTMLSAALAANTDDGVSATVEPSAKPDLKALSQEEFYYWALGLPNKADPNQPSDSTGYVLTDAGRAALDETASTAPVDVVTETDDDTTTRVLCSAATYLDRHGWIQGAYYDSVSGSFTPPACMVGAIGMVCYGGPVEAPAQHFDDPGFLDFEQAVLHLDRYLLVENSSESYEFNDARGRRAEDVTRVLRDAAGRPTHELIDALRAIDQANADNAALAELLVPSGVFGEQAGPVCPTCGSEGRKDRRFVAIKEGYGSCWCVDGWHDRNSCGGDA